MTSTYIKVKVVTDSKKEKVEQIDNETYKVWVSAPAERGLANSRVRELLIDQLGTTAIRLVSGHTSPSKIFSVNN